MNNCIALDGRLLSVAALAMDALAGRESPRAADIGCDHGYLAAYLLESLPRLFLLCSDVSAPSLDKARRLIARQGLDARVQFAVADGLCALDEPVHAVMIAGMGGKTILSIVKAGMERIGDAALIVQANVDVPLLREGLAQMGFALRRELYAQAAGRHYITLMVVRGDTKALTAREALLGMARCGAMDAAQRGYLAWQRNVRMRELQGLARLSSESAVRRMKKIGAETTWISEAFGMKTCTVADIKHMVGEIAPYELAEEWDNVGLLFGRRGDEVTRVLVALDLTQEALDQARALGAELILTHHPIMFSARKRVTDEDREGALMLDMAKAGIAHIAAHTNLDSAPGGVNDVLMQLMGAEDVRGEGCVRVGALEDGMTFGALCARAQKRLGGAVRAYGAADAKVRTLGCCSGAGGSEMGIAREMGADCFITGEVRHHEALDAMACGMCVIEAGHYETENPVCEVLASALQNAADALQYKLTVFCSKGNPFGR